MFIRNITDRNTPKVIGVGSVWLQPGEEKFVPDTGLYVDEIDEYGKKTGKKVVINAIANQVRLNMLEIINKEEPKAPVVDTQNSEEEAEEKPVAKTTRATRKTKAQ